MTVIRLRSVGERMWVSESKQKYRRAGFTDKEILALRHAYRSGTTTGTELMDVVEWKGSVDSFLKRLHKLCIPVGPRHQSGKNTSPDWKPKKYGRKADERATD